MITLTLSDLARLSGAAEPTDGGRTTVSQVVVDSRQATPRSVFVALDGTRDGHEFIADAYARGAIAALVRGDAAVDTTMTVLRVADPLIALGLLSQEVRARLGATVVAVTGSVGKTCTKDFAATILSQDRRVVASPASFNNEIGVPLTLLAADEQTDVVVAEAGARGVGHLRALGRLLRHDIAVVTGVSSAHIGMFGSLEGVAQAKAELVQDLPSTGIAILNADDPAVAAMRTQTSARVVTFGMGSGADVHAADVTVDDVARASFTLGTPDGTARCSLPVPGEHMIVNALAAATVAQTLGVGPEAIAQGLALVTTSPHRMRLVTSIHGATIIDDSYNASPVSVAAALKTLVRIGKGRRTWAVLGAMAELGAQSQTEHDRAGRLAVRLGVGRVIVVGEDARALYEAARLEGLPPDDLVFASDAAAAAKILEAEVASGDVVLVKASRVAGLERVVEALT